MLYKTPEINQTFNSKFVRVEDSIFVTKPDDLGTTHYNLAREHDLLELIAQLKSESPEEVDGGFYSAFPPVLYVTDDSMGLALPVVKRAREITVEVFLKLSPGFKVATDQKELKELFEALRKAK